MSGARRPTQAAGPATADAAVQTEADLRAELATIRPLDGDAMAAAAAHLDRLT